MSFSNPVPNPNGDPSEEKLRDWGDTQRRVSPPRRGRFSNVLDRLANPANTAPQQSWFRPALLIGGASLIAVSCALVQLCEGPKGILQHKAAVAEESDQNAPTKREDPTKSRALVNYAGGISATAEPVFRSRYLQPNNLISGRQFAEVPFIVKIENKGSKLDGNIVVATTSMRQYSYPISISAGGSLNKVVYGSASNPSWERNVDSITLETGRHKFVLYARPQEVAYSAESDNPVIAILDKRPDLLTPRFGGWGNQGIRKFTPYFARPQYAPDRVSGYDPVDVIVLGKESENLNAAQWDALQQWIKAGGALVLLGKGEGSRVLQTQFARDLSPLTVAGTLKPDASTLSLPAGIASYKQPESSRYAAFRHVGLGTVFFLRFDPLIDSFREDGYRGLTLWNRITQHTNSLVKARNLRDASGESPWIQVIEPYAGPKKEVSAYPIAANDPFHTSLPALPNLVYLFLGYFVLVVPVSFVILKQTRRLHYAWFTGPALAMLTAGGITLFSTTLYSAPRSSRTAGILTMAADDGTAQFHGFTELYTPHGGRFSVDVQGTQRNLEDRSYTEYYNGTGTTSHALAGLATVETDNVQEPVTLDMPNLSFRRIFHQQTMSLGKGITANLAINSRGELVGSVQNNSGLVLNNVIILFRGEKTINVRNYTNGTGNHHVKMQVYQLRTFSLGTLSAGKHAVCASNSTSTTTEPLSNLTNTDYPNASVRRWQKYGINLNDGASVFSFEPMLFARTSGASFGPKDFGKEVGGNNSVSVIVRLPALLSDSTSASLKGGNAQ